MRKDLKTGMFIGIGLVFVGWVLFALYSDTPQQRRQKQWALTPASAESKPVSRAQQSTAESAVGGSTPPAAKIESPVIEPKEQKPQKLIHTVVAGQTLSAISTLYYGKPDGWQEILDANPDILKTPSDLRPGMQIKIPPK